MSIDKAELRVQVRETLGESVSYVNKALSGIGLDEIESVLRRFEKSNQLPHWYPKLKSEYVLPNLDGKTIGSVIEKLFVAVLEVYILKSYNIPTLRINPARGVDIPDLELGLKAPSENFCTSEPFFSAYERLLGNEYDAVIFLTDYQAAKKHPPLRLAITDFRYLKGSQIADATLCKVAIKHRDWLGKENEYWAKKLFRFLAYVNQSDWRGKWLLRLVRELDNEANMLDLIKLAKIDFLKQNRIREMKDIPLILDEDIDSIEAIQRISPLRLGALDAADNWVVQVLKDAGRYPSDNEWNRLVKSPLDGQIGMSFALQWRYNFGRLFGQSAES